MLSRKLCGEKSRANSTAETILGEKLFLYQDGKFWEHVILSQSRDLKNWYLSELNIPYRKQQKY